MKKNNCYFNTLLNKCKPPINSRRRYRKSKREKEYHPANNTSTPRNTLRKTRLKELRKTLVENTMEESRIPTTLRSHAATFREESPRLDGTQSRRLFARIRSKFSLQSFVEMERE